MASIPALYGSFNLNDGINYFVTGKDDLAFPTVKQVYFKVARLEGMKKTGESVDEKTITVDMAVLGISRADLENKLDALFQALNKRGQYLNLHTNDGRSFVADAISAPFPLKQGDILKATGTVTFVALNPYANGTTAMSYASGATTLALISGTTYKFPNFSITGQGNVFSRPNIHLVNTNGASWSQVQVQQLTDSSTLTITGSLPTATNDYIDIYCDPSGSNGFSAIKNGTVTLTVNGIFPIIEPTSTNFIVTVTAASAPTGTLTITWNPRFLS